MKNGRLSLVIAQVLTMLQAFILGATFAVFSYVSFFYNDILNLLIDMAGTLWCVLTFAFAIAGVRHATASGFFKKGSAIVSSVFNGVVILGALILYLFKDIYSVPLAVMFVLSFAAIPSFALLIEGMIKAAKQPFIEPRQPPMTFSSSTSPENAQSIANLCALWKLYEQKLITEEEYISRRNVIFYRSNPK